MKLSIVIICWNDLKVIPDCLASIYATARTVDFEVIVSDNGSTDGCIEFIKENYPQVRIVRNGSNLGFARGNNAGIRASTGEYVLILNPDTIIHERCLDTWIPWADTHPDAGAFGCRVVNPDGSYQRSARPLPSLRAEWMGALYLWPLSYLSRIFMHGEYVGWVGDSERSIGWQSGCCILVRRKVLEQLDGFDAQFFYHCEEVDLCRRVWDAGYPILFTPTACITHLGGQSVNRFPLKFAIEKQRSRYKYFYKHNGPDGARSYRRLALASVRLRQFGYGLLSVVRPSAALRSRLEMYRVVEEWTRELDPVRFVQRGQEPVGQHSSYQIGKNY